MTPEDEIRLLKKVIAFLDARWAAFRHNLRVIQVGRTQAVVNGIASPHYPHFRYLEKRRVKAWERLEELQKLPVD